MAKLSLDELALLKLAVLDLAVLLNPLPISIKLVVVESAFLGGAVGQDDLAVAVELIIQEVTVELRSVIIYQISLPV